MHTDTRLFLTGLNLAYTDRASMAASTEVRVPYVDKEVAAAAFAIPGTAKITGRERKAILKEQAAEASAPQGDRVPPQGTVQRAAAGLDPPRPGRHDRGPGRRGPGDIGAGGQQMVRTMIDDDRRGAADRSKEIWQLLTLEVWYQQQGRDR